MKELQLEVREGAPQRGAEMLTIVLLFIAFIAVTSMAAELLIQSGGTASGAALLTARMVVKLVEIAAVAAVATATAVVVATKWFGLL